MKGNTLLVLRHGKSDWTTGHEDFHRPLVSRGHLGSQKMGAWIKARKLLPDAVLSSPAERARATTVAACEAMGLPLNLSLIHISSALPFRRCCSSRRCRRCASCAANSAVRRAVCSALIWLASWRWPA